MENNEKIEVKIPGWVILIVVFPVFALSLWYAIAGTIKWLSVISAVVAVVIGIPVIVVFGTIITMPVRKRKLMKQADSIIKGMSQSKDNLINRLNEAESLCVVLVPGEENPAIITVDGEKYCCVSMNIDSPDDSILDNVARNADIDFNNFSFGQFSVGEVVDMVHEHGCGIAFMEGNKISYLPIEK